MLNKNILYVSIDYFSLINSYDQVSPRVGVAYHFARTKSVVHGAYNRYFSPPPIEYSLLASFIGSPQRVLGRDRLIELSRVRLGDASDRSIDVLVSRLRRKLLSAGQAAPITTVRGVGYMLTADVTHA